MPVVAYRPNLRHQKYLQQLQKVPYGFSRAEPIMNYLLSAHYGQF